MALLGKLWFLDKPIQQMSHHIAKKLPFMRNTSVTKNVAEFLGTSEEGAHLAMISVAASVTPGLFKIIWTPVAVREMYRAYRKEGFKGANEVGKWFLYGSTVMTTKKVISKVFKKR
jgi:hypothetical protein